MHGRWLATLVVSLALVAGCLGSVEDPDRTQETFTQNETEEATPADIVIEHDFAEGPDERTVEVPDGTFADVVRLSFDSPPAYPDEVNGPCAFVEPPEISVRGPDGGVVFQTEAQEDGNIQATPCPASSLNVERTERVNLDPGTWTVSFEGQGVGSGIVVIQG